MPRAGLRGVAGLCNTGNVVVVAWDDWQSLVCRVPGVRRPPGGHLPPDSSIGVICW